MAPHAQTTLVLSGFSSPEQMVAAENRMEADSALQKARQELERGTEPAFDSRQRVLLRTADFSPEIVPLTEKPQRPRYFEIAQRVPTGFYQDATGVFHGFLGTP